MNQTSYMIEYLVFVITCIIPLLKNPVTMLSTVSCNACYIHNFTQKLVFRIFRRFIVWNMNISILWLTCFSGWLVIFRYNTDPIKCPSFFTDPSINRINGINSCSSRTFPIWLHFVRAENFAGTTSPTSHFRFPMISTQIPFPTSVFKNWLSSPDNSTIACPTRSSWKKSSSWRLKIPTAYLS